MKKVIKPFLSKTTLLLRRVSIYGGVAVFVLGLVARDSGALDFGYYALGFGFTMLTAGVVLDWPERCPYGHTDIGFYYGRFSCRTCYRMRKSGRKVSN